MNCWPSVTAVWPKWIDDFEGTTTWMYLDTKGKVTTGVGFLIDSVAEAQALIWLKSDGLIAAPAEIEAEWLRVKAAQYWTEYNGLDAHWRDSATLNLQNSAVAKLLLVKTDQFWARLLETVPDAPSWPADAQLAVLDEAWQNGPAYLDAKDAQGHYVWNGTRAAVVAQDWTSAASHVPGSGRRADARKRLFMNANLVVANKLDPSILWNTSKPTVPIRPPSPVVYRSTRYKSDYLQFNGGWVPPKTYDILVAVQAEGWDDWGKIRLSQGGLSTVVAASSLTHAGLGAFDIAIDGRSKAKVDRLCSRLLRSGVVAFPRGFINDSFQDNKHIHCVRWTSTRPLHREAYDQLHSRAFGYLHGGGGLAGRPWLRYSGPSTPLDRWEKSPYNLDNIRPGGITYVVTASVLKGLDVDRDLKVERKKGYTLTAAKEVRRWDRWNAVTKANTYYAIGSGLLEPIPVFNPTGVNNV